MASYVEIVDAAAEGAGEQHAPDHAEGGVEVGAPVAQHVQGDLWCTQHAHTAQLGKGRRTGEALVGGTKPAAQQWLQ